MNNLKGEPFGFFVQGKATNNVQYSRPKKQKHEKEKVQEKLTEINLDGYNLEDLKNNRFQMIIVDLLGRIIWMNERFAFYNFKTEDDLMEGVYGEFGFEVFTSTLTYIGKSSMEKYETEHFEFVRLVKIY